MVARATHRYVDGLCGAEDRVQGSGLSADCRTLHAWYMYSTVASADSSPGGLFGSEGVPTRPAGYTGDGSRADSRIPPLTG
jgi:hypothetical protein